MKTSQDMKSNDEFFQNAQTDTHGGGGHQCNTTGSGIHYHASASTVVSVFYLKMLDDGGGNYTVCVCGGILLNANYNYNKKCAVNKPHRAS